MNQEQQNGVWGFIQTVGNKHSQIASAVIHKDGSISEMIVATDDAMKRARAIGVTPGQVAEILACFVALRAVKDERGSTRRDLWDLASRGQSELQTTLDAIDAQAAEIARLEAIVARSNGPGHGEVAGEKGEG